MPSTATANGGQPGQPLPRGSEPDPIAAESIADADADAAIMALPQEKRPRLELASSPADQQHPAPIPVPDPSVDHSDLARSFKGRLFRKDPSEALSAAYARRDAAAEERRRLRSQKKATLRELRELQAQFEAKKEELLDRNFRLKASAAELGKWNRAVFDLELAEPCPWNDKLGKLREYVAKHGAAPGPSKRTEGTDEERALVWFVSRMRKKVQAGEASQWPHRVAALEELGVRWESENDARFETMFAKLLAYKKEHGTFRMPSLDLCKESGDEDLILLHNWVFSQVGSFRYQLQSKKVEAVKRFLDVGFSFERWYATNGHVFERNIPKFDDFCRRYVANGGRMDEADAEALRKASEQNIKKMKRKYKKRKKRKREGDDEGANDQRGGGGAAGGDGTAAGGAPTAKAEGKAAGGTASEPEGAKATVDAAVGDSGATPGVTSQDMVTDMEETAMSGDAAVNDIAALPTTVPKDPANAPQGAACFEAEVGGTATGATEEVVTIEL